MGAGRGDRAAGADRVDRQPLQAYTTILSVMRKLEKAGWLTHRPKGEAIYTSRFDRVRRPVHFAAYLYRTGISGRQAAFVPGACWTTKNLND